MAWNPFNRKKPSDFNQKLKAAREVTGGEAFLVQDTRAAIEELSQVVKNDPEAVEIYLALGSLYRSQGEIERAIHIRNSLIVRPGLAREFKARALFELGRDFRRGGFLDRAAQAFEDARAQGQDAVAIQHEMARLAAERGAFEKAAEAFGQLNLPLPQAHYLVRLAMDYFKEGKESQANRSLRHAIRAYPGAVEAWLEQMVQAYKSGSERRVADILREALDNVASDLRFVLLEGLLQALIKAERPMDTPPDENAEWAGVCSDRAVVTAVVPVIESQEPDVLLLYYGGVYLLRIGDIENAKSWFEKTLVMQSDFWLARLELFEQSRMDQTLTPFFMEQLNFFIDRARMVRRFFCRRCGLKRDHLFYNCPRCRSWHSIGFRKDFSQ
ncbi:MAG: tetratricopeptide repeat protein [Pseudodesulfovibrio sp.]|uniref:Tetratricopeptide TPR_4 n=1 Tax=Pseudodesulfovibrio aespoeensis (strain ATCC 700646 / DSM 10631 / Aspo-2) TaxID=643562 RepID=E6VX53_PSEA9|nr:MULTISPECIES: tetratricopeptide repeat protein [Pseudodesulfovibrio]MBU4192142.1 tetratricopeptide repeat protein [Pseudomonadota bacterium]ADU62559.1 tetratricopeptide TPR_4 [Pseudodesulfovibrio aespoeensis Aspo-2]MBU4243249.1 tetratricopeptide repeat protein [Pseudomonadota bacterium]MBU4378745.1 tetratricopeptide repeat protein [Pseudomonadota bacterium]MBU4476161.1 tetratricopeptide repeat protein [Pseudomonadota bacterium]